MNQNPLFIITPENRTKYYVKHNNRTLETWYFGGIFYFSNYSTAKDVEVLERIGNEKEIFK